MSNEELAQTMPHYLALKSGKPDASLPELKFLADSGNMYSSYVLGSYFLFGQMPRHYSFNVMYPAGLVQAEALTPLNPAFGLSHLVRLLKFKDNVAEAFQLECVYDLYKIVQGSAPFFKTNDINCRPQPNENSPMRALFSSAKKLMDLLLKLDHYEIYLDYAKTKLSEFNQSNDQSDLNEALSYLNKITDVSEFNVFSFHDVSQAHFLLGKLYLQGNDYITVDPKIGIPHIQKARSDDGYEMLLDYYKQYGDKYRKSMSKSIYFIKDVDRRQALLAANGFEIVPLPDISALLLKAASQVVAYSDEYYAELEAEMATIALESSKPSVVVVDEEAIRRKQLEEHAAAMSARQLTDDLDESYEESDGAAEGDEPIDEYEGEDMGFGEDIFEGDDFEMPDELST